MLYEVLTGIKVVRVCVEVWGCVYVSDVCGGCVCLCVCVSGCVREYVCAGVCGGGVCECVWGGDVEVCVSVCDSVCEVCRGMVCVHACLCRMVCVCVTMNAGLVCPSVRAILVDLKCLSGLWELK